jgi:hypothetical protein
MQKCSTKCIVSFLLLFFILTGLTYSIKNAEAVNAPIKHSTTTVILSVKFGRIYFHPNTVTCSKTAHPCFYLKYVSNDGPLPVWIDKTQEYILYTGQNIPFTFSQTGIHKLTLFQNSVWWKVWIIVT